MFITPQELLLLILLFIGPIILSYIIPVKNTPSNFNIKMYRCLVCFVGYIYLFYSWGILNEQRNHKDIMNVLNIISLDNPNILVIFVYIIVPLFFAFFIQKIMVYFANNQTTNR